MVQLTAIGALAFHRDAFLKFWLEAPFALKLLASASVLLPALFLIPLPPQVWTALPGRELVAQSLELAGGIGWTTASVDPVRTLLAITALITPLAVLFIGWKAPRAHLITLGWVVVILGLANVAVGIFQVLSNGATGLFYPEIPMPGILFGAFANRNTAGLFLVACLTFAALLPAPPQAGQAALPARIIICLLLLVAILLTRSRTSLVIAFLPIAALCLRVLRQKISTPRKGQRGNETRKWATLAAVVLTLGAVASVGVMVPGRLGDVIERFQSDRTDARTYIWEDASYSASRYWPVGSGMGTFDDVFQTDESLENITQRRAGRAHNDYLEVAIEAGAPGLLLITGWLALLAWLSWQARGREDRWIAWSGSITLVALALQSVTDYPLRNQTMLAIAGFALVVLVRFSAPRRGAKI
ncbi:O-antigen ligase family protein [Erythrobacter longus]|uniref:O-antigen ligase family protein n=1 Tax=Erythrobacter longus TaxID=1044 RepID=UPI000AA32D4E|nr:O-antigen ligase family protein [Erythrobacter longus]